RNVAIPANDSNAKAVGNPIRNALLRLHAANQRNISPIAGTGRTGRLRHNHGCQKNTVRHDALSPVAANTAIWRIPGKGANIMIR
ncbi:hypothetical protein ACV355_32705, partial [Pseudomonas aeruginosa]